MFFQAAKTLGQGTWVPFSRLWFLSEEFHATCRDRIEVITITT